MAAATTNPTVDLSSLSKEDLIKQLSAANTKLASNKKAVSLKVSAKGAVSIYGIRRFPVTFYKDEFAVILGMAEEIENFIAANDKQLSSK